MAGSSPSLHSAQMSPLRDKADLGFSAFAHAAFLRVCGDDCLVVQHISQKLPFKRVNRAGSDLSLHGA